MINRNSSLGRGKYANAERIDCNRVYNELWWCPEHVDNKIKKTRYKTYTHSYGITTVSRAL